MARHWKLQLTLLYCLKSFALLKFFIYSCWYVVLYFQPCSVSFCIQKYLLCLLFCCCSLKLIFKTLAVSLLYGIKMSESKRAKWNILYECPNDIVHSVPFGYLSCFSTKFIWFLGIASNEPVKNSNFLLLLFAFFEQCNDASTLGSSVVWWGYWTVTCTVCQFFGSLLFLFAWRATLSF